MSTDLIKVKVIPNAVIRVPMLAKGSSTASQQNTKSYRDHCKSPLWILEGTLCSLTLRNIAIFTARKQSLRRLCFYTCLSVILFMAGRVWWWGERAWQGEGACMMGGMHGGGVHGRGACMPHTPDTTRYGRSMRGRYASYWNAFLFKKMIVIYFGTDQISRYFSQPHII